MTIILKAILIVGTLTAPQHTLRAATELAGQCGTATSWSEQVMPGMWVAGCGDAEGNDAPSCFEHSWLAYELAKGAGRDAEEAYYAALDSCEGE